MIWNIVFNSGHCRSKNFGKQRVQRKRRRLRWKVLAPKNIERTWNSLEKRCIRVGCKIEGGRINYEPECIFPPSTKTKEN